MENAVKIEAVLAGEEASPSPSERISSLDSLRAIAVIMIVGVHSRAYSTGLPQDLDEFFTFLFITASVPAFFLADGYLFARSRALSRNYGYLQYVRKSFVRLLVPWAIFTLAYTCARYVFELTGFFEDKIIVGRAWQQVAIAAYGSVYAPQLYFLFSLFLIRLCTPIIELLFVRKSYVTVLALFICYYLAFTLSKSYLISCLDIAGGQEPLLHALQGLKYYLAGIIAYKTWELTDIRKLFIPCLVLFISTLIIRNTTGSHWPNLIQYLYLFTLFLFFMLFQNGFPVLNYIGRNTMGIFLLHAPITLKGVSLVLNRFILDPIWSYAAVTSGAFVLSLCITGFINRIPYGSYLFGMPYVGKRRERLHPAVSADEQRIVPPSDAEVRKAS